MLPSDQQFRLKWNNHRNTVMHEFELLLRDDRLVDCTLGADGKYVKAHKVVLSACSPYLRDLLTEHFDKHPIILLKDVPFNDLKYMIDYMYCGEVNILEADLPSFLKSSQSLKIKGLADDCIDDTNSNDSGSAGRSKENVLENTNENLLDTVDEPPMKKPVPAAVLFSNSMPENNGRPNVPKQRKQSVTQQQSFQNTVSNCSQNSMSNSTSPYNSFQVEPEIDLEENNIDGGSDNESLNSEMLEEVMFPSTINPLARKLRTSVKDEPLPDDGNDDPYDESGLDADGSYNDSIPQSANSIADQILAGKNLNELTITSYTDNEVGASVREEGDRFKKSSRLMATDLYIGHVVGGSRTSSSVKSNEDFGVMYSIQCTRCFKQLPDNVSYYIHKANECKKMPEIYTCDFCFYKSKWKSNLKRHKVMVHKHLLEPQLVQGT